MDVTLEDALVVPEPTAKPVLSTTGTSRIGTDVEQALKMMTQTKEKIYLRMQDSKKNLTL
jgi:hypothetical protein